MIMQSKYVVEGSITLITVTISRKENVGESFGEFGGMVISQKRIVLEKEI